MPVEGNPIYEASQRVQAFLDARTQVVGLDPETIIKFENTELRVSDLKLLVATAVFATKGQA